jgi:ketosteroid isomerase-like protein
VSEGNAELVRAAYEAWNSGGIDAVLEYLHPDVELRDPPEAPDAQVWHGHEGYRRQIEQFMAAWAEASIQPEEIVETGDKVLVRVHYRVRGKQQGIEAELHIFHVLTLRDGKAILVEVHGDEGRAREAAGLPE